MKGYGILGLMLLVAIVVPIGVAPQAGAAGDSDDDGFDDDIELYLGTDPMDNCPDDPTDDAWPLDIQIDGVITLLDILSTKAKIGALQTGPEWSPEVQRVDLDGDGAVSGVFDMIHFYRGMMTKACDGGTPHPPSWSEGSALTMGIDPEIAGNSASTLGDLELCVRVDVDPGDFSDGATDHTIDVYVSGDVSAPTGYDAWVTYDPDRVNPVSWDDVIKLPGAMSLTREMTSRLNAAAGHTDWGSGIPGAGTLVRIDVDAISAGPACLAFGFVAYSSAGEIHPASPRVAMLAINEDCPTEDLDGDDVFDICDNCPSDANQGQEDFDGDGWGDACDACPTTSTPWFTPPGDEDCDGFTTAAENYVGTDPLDACPQTSTPNDEDPDAWPVDMDDDQGADIVDVMYFKPYILTSVPPSPQRFDFDADGDIDIVDILKYKPFILKSCTP